LHLSLCLIVKIFQSRVILKRDIGSLCWGSAMDHLAFLPRLLCYEDLAGLGAFKGAYNADLLHLIHDPCSTGISKLQPSLEKGYGSLSAIQDDIHRLRQHLVILTEEIIGISAAAGGFPAAVATRLRFLNTLFASM